MWVRCVRSNGTNVTFGFFLDKEKQNFVEWGEAQKRSSLLLMLSFVWDDLIGLQTINNGCEARSICEAAVNYSCNNMSYLWSAAGPTTSADVGIIIRGFKSCSIDQFLLYSDQIDKKRVKCSVTVPSGKIIGKQNIILSPFSRMIFPITRYADIPFLLCLMAWVSWSDGRQILNCTQR